MAERRSLAELGRPGAELMELCRRTGEPVFLTDGRGAAGVLLSLGAYEAGPLAGRLRGPGALRERFFAAARQLRECGDPLRRPRRRG